MMNLKDFRETIEANIKILCESGNFDINLDEFNIDVDIQTNYKRIGNIVLSNVLIIDYKTTLTEKNNKFKFSVIGNTDLRYIAYYVVDGYIQQRNKYINDKIKHITKKEIPKKTWLNKIFNK